MNNIIGQTFNQLTITHILPNKIKNKTHWAFKCSCGNTGSAASDDIKANSTKSCGCARGAQLCGRRFGKLEVLQSESSQKGHKKWLCKCDCGNTRICGTTYLTQTPIPSCGCHHKTTLPTGIATFNYLVTNYRYQATQRQLVFDLTVDECKDLFQGNCYYCSASPSQTLTMKHYNGSYTYNGIDRQDNSQGYTSTNCVSCCHNCNHAKCTQTAIYYQNQMSRIHNHCHDADVRLTTIRSQLNILTDNI